MEEYKEQKKIHIGRISGTDVLVKPRRYIRHRSYRTNVFLTI